MLEPSSVSSNDACRELVMLGPHNRKRLEEWTLILAAWFLRAKGRGHLNCGCAVDQVFMDLMACISGRVASLD
jgi:hypothetical protein